ncbi:MAG: putative sulfate exporter family transporter, partial [Natronomonas sp.]|nr:putative sulfate exporter family transporter [Natronomonas sp.]
MKLSSRGPVTAALPGLGLLAVVALCAHLVSVAVPQANGLLVAIFIGFVAANTVTIPARFELGLSVHKLLLEVGIIVMGVRLSLAELVRTGPLLVALALVTIAFGIL